MLILAGAEMPQDCATKTMPAQISAIKRQILLERVVKIILTEFIKVKGKNSAELEKYLKTIRIITQDAILAICLFESILFDEQRPA